MATSLTRAGIHLPRFGALFHFAAKNGTKKAGLIQAGAYTEKDIPIWQ
jgi:hypothetical protein